METTNVLVTGGCGFLGTAVISALLDNKRYTITTIDINPPALGSEIFTKDVRYVRANVLDIEALQKVFNEVRPVMVVHTVGVYPLGTARFSMKGKESIFEVNVEGTRNVLQAAKECGARGLLYTSSTTVVLDELDKDFKNVDESWPTGRAHTSYGLSKAIAEELVLSANAHDFATCALRSAPIFGPNDPTCIPIMHSCISNGQTPFVLGTGNNMQDFVYITNIANAHVLAVANLLDSQTAAGEAMFITNGEPITLRDMCIAVWKEFGHVPNFQMNIPEGLVWWLGYVSEWIDWFTGKQGALSCGVVSDGCRDRYVSIARARSLLGYEPRVRLEDGIRISCQEYRKRITNRAKK